MPTWKHAARTLFSAGLAPLSRIVLRKLRGADNTDYAAIYKQKATAWADHLKVAAPRAIRVLRLKMACGVTCVVSFFLLFSEFLRQIDATGAPFFSAFMAGYLILFLAAAVTAVLLPFPSLRPLAPGEPLASLPNEELPGTFHNVEQLRPLRAEASGADVFFAELRAERQIFLNGR